MVTALTRRQLLAMGGAASMAALTAACGGKDSPSASSSSGTSSAGTASASSFGTTTTATLDEIFDAGFTSSGVTGLAGVYRQGADVWTRSTGVRDLSSGAAFRPDDFVRIASITKSYTATAVLQLVDEGKIDLSAVLETYVPGVPNGTVATIEQVLGMQSGIPDFTADQAFLAEFDADPTLPWSNEKTLEVIKRNPPDFSPGAKVVCDSNYALLGMVIEKVTGKTAGEVITTKVIQPLGLADTSYPTGNGIPEPHPNGYVPVVQDGSTAFDNATNPPRLVNDVNPAVASTAGAIISTLDDLQKWGEELVKGTLLKPETQKKRLATKRLDGVEIDFGYGLGIFNVGDFFGHNGAIYGFSTIVLTDAKTDTQLAFVCNESTNFTSPTTELALQIIQKLYPDMLKP